MNSRYFLMFKLLFIKSPMKRAEYLKRKGIFRHCGNRVMITSRKIPLYPNLISIGNNVWIASGVSFITHDVAHFMLNGLNTENDFKYMEKIGCIEIGDNVFIGSNVQILYNVKVGNNVIIAAGSCVIKDVPDNSVVGGVPAEVIASFDDFIKKRRNLKTNYEANNVGQYVTKECADEMWSLFKKIHS